MRPFALVNSSWLGRSAVGIALTVLLAPVPPAEAASQSPGGPSDETAGYYFLMGRYLENEGRIDEAIAALRKAIGMAPTAAEPHAELAGLYARQNLAGEAIDSARRALARDPDNVEANRILGTIYAALGEAGQPVRPGEDPATYRRVAIEALEKSRKAGAFDANAELMLGRLYAQSEEPAKAIGPLRRVVEDYPGYPDAALLLADAYAATGQAAQAVETLEQAIAVNPGFLRGRLRLAELYEAQRRYREAADTYAAARAANPRLDFTSAQAAALINAGHSDEARRMLVAALARRAAAEPGHLYLLGQAERRLGNAAAAAEAAARLQQVAPGDVRAVYLTAQLATDAGRHDEAIHAYEKLIASAPEDTSFVYGYAHALDKAGRPADAERALRGVLQRDPRDAAALNALGYMFAERGERLEEAVALVQQALEIEPGNPSFLDSLGWAYFRQGRFDRADEPLTQAAAALPRTSVVQDHLGDLRLQQKRLPEAIAAWERALDGDGEEIDRSAIEKKIRDAQQRLGKE